MSIEEGRVSGPVLVTPLRMTGGEWKHGTDNGYTNHGCRCYWCTKARADYMKRWRQHDEVPDHVHGTYNGYSNYLCRCELCNQARADYMDEWRERVPEHVHGTYNGYNNYLCRCEECRQAYSKTKSMAYQRRKDRRA